MCYSYLFGLLDAGVEEAFISFNFAAFLPDDDPGRLWAGGDILGADVGVFFLKWEKMRNLHK